MRLFSASFLCGLFRGSPPIPPKPTKWLSWYRPPLRDYIEWLCLDPQGNGYIYSRDRDRAHRFDTAEEALKPTPVYDGSPGIIQRTGVEPE